MFLRLSRLVLLPLSVATGWSQTLTNGDWVYSISNNAATISSYMGPGGDVAIPSSIDEIPVTMLWSGGRKRSIFGWSNATVVRVAVPNSVTNINAFAFQNCTELKNVVVPDSVLNIGAWAFYGCSNLASVIIGSNVTVIGSSAFSSTGNLTSILCRGSAPASSTWAGGLPTNSTIYFLPGASGWQQTYGGRGTQVFEPAASHPSFTTPTGFQFLWTNTGSIPMNVRRTASLGGPWTVVSTNNVTRQFVDPNPPSGKAFYQAYLP